MKPLRIRDASRAARGRALRGRDLEFKGVAIDSRQVRPGELFFAIKGERFDGHDFCEQAVQAGAVGVVVSDSSRAPKAGAAVRVKDTRQALGDLARFYRGQVDTRAVAVTGSNGKTTVKEMIAAILAAGHTVVKAEASFNNNIGVPLTVFRLEPGVQFGVFELEMNQLGGTRRLAEVCQPELGVVTNVGDTHLEYMRNRQNVAREKAELLEVLPEDGTAVLNRDDPLVMKIGREYCRSRTITFGIEQEADVRADNLKPLGLEGIEFRLNGRHRVRLRLPGRHNVANCLAACASAYGLGIDLAEAAARLEEFEPPPMRFEVRRLGSVVLIDDAYNANPQSMAAAIELLCAHAPKERRMAFLGDMLELGEQALPAHTRLGQEAASCLHRVVFVGPLARHAASVAIKTGMDPGRMRVVGSEDPIPDEVFDLIEAGDTILVKGSRAMRMERLVQGIVERYGGKPDQVH